MGAESGKRSKEANGTWGELKKWETQDKMLAHPYLGSTNREGRHTARLWAWQWWMARGQTRDFVQLKGSTRNKSLPLFAALSFLNWNITVQNAPCSVQLWALEPAAKRCSWSPKKLPNVAEKGEENPQNRSWVLQMQLPLSITLSSPIIIVALITCEAFPPGIQSQDPQSASVYPKATVDRSAAAVSLALGGI